MKKPQHCPSHIRTAETTRPDNVAVAAKLSATKAVFQAWAGLIHQVKTLMIDIVVLYLAVRHFIHFL